MTPLRSAAVPLRLFTIINSLSWGFSTLPFDVPEKRAAAWKRARAALLSFGVHYREFARERLRNSKAAVCRCSLFSCVFGLVEKWWKCRGWVGDCGFGWCVSINTVNFNKFDNSMEYYWKWTMSGFGFVDMEDFIFH